MPLAGVTGGSLIVSNNLERVRVIRDDGRIEAADPTIATCTGAMTMRFDGGTLVGEAANGEPVSLTYGFTMGPVPNGTSVAGPSTAPGWRSGWRFPLSPLPEVARPCRDRRHHGQCR